MLTQLLAIKKRREHSIRQRIAAFSKRAQQLKKQQQQLMQQRDALRNAWRLANQQQQRVPQGKLCDIQHHLGNFYQQEQTIVQQQHTLEQALLQIDAEQAEQKRLLHHNRIEQQKLTYLLEELP